MAWTSDPASLDPALAVDVVGGAACAMLYEGLVALDRDGRLVPGLADSWEISADRLTYRFRLDPAARASDGSPVGAAEAVASFRRLLAPDTASPRAWVLERIVGAAAYARGEAATIAGLRAVGADVVEIVLTSPTASFLGLLAMPNAAVLPAGGAATGEIATGPWVLVEHVRDAHLRLRRNPHWHREPAPFADVFVRILPEEFTRVAEFEVGRLDILEIPPAESRRFREHPDLAAAVHRQVALVTEYVGLNNEDPVLADPRVRRALNHAVNVDLILERVLEGRGVRSTGPVPPSLPGGGSCDPYDHDPERARRLLTAAGVPAEWTLRLWQRPSPLASQVLEAIQADLAVVGVRAEIRLRDWSALKASIDRGEAAAFFINWFADYPDPENFLAPLFHSRNVGGGGNRARVRDPALDAALERLDAEFDPAVRADLVRGIEARLREAAPWIYLWHPVLEVAVSDRVAGYRPHPVASCERWLDARPAAPAGDAP